MAKMNVNRARDGDDDFGAVGAEPTMPAKYAATCATCKQRFAVGDPIASVVIDKKTTYHHGACRYPATALLAQNTTGDDFDVVATTRKESTPGKCRATTSKGKPCNNTPQKGEQFCGPHLTQRVARPSLIAHESFVQSDPERLYVRDIGHGVPIIVLHGGPDFDHEYLLPDMDRLADSFHLVYYDQRGRGRSFSGRQPHDVTMATEVDDLDRVREWFGFESIAILGHSWGGLLAMEYAIRHPERLSHLILMNSAPASRADSLVLRHELARRRSPAQTERMNELRSDPRFQAGDIDTEAEYYRIHYSTTLRNPDQLDAVVRRLRSAFSEDGIVAARAIEDLLYEGTWARDGYDLLPALRRLEIPALLIDGDDDFVPREVVGHIANAIPASRLVTLVDCGHFAYLEQPDQVNTIITTFMTSS